MARRKKLSSEPFELVTEHLLENGRGAASFENRKIEVYGSLPGETSLVRHLFGRRFRDQAETLQVLASSPDRVQPRCPNFGTCSACTMQHLAPAAQLAFKQEAMLGHLGRLGNVHPESVLAPLSSERWNYRRKARLSVRYVEVKGRVLVGFRERDGRFVTDMNECHIMTTAVTEQLGPLAELIARMDAVKDIPQIEICCGDNRCALIFRHLQPLAEVDLQRLRDFARDSGMSVLLQASGPESIQALEEGYPHLTYALPEFDLEFQFEPLDFVQVNAGLNRKMVQQAIGLLQPGNNDRVLDLFCGLGNFSLAIARTALSVTGIEGDEGLVSRARRNAQINGLTNVEYLRADLYAQTQAGQFTAGQYRKVLLDPPRSGAEPVLAAIAGSGAERVVYVSCNPQSLATDAGLLVHKYGFRLVSAGVMDMFPHTSHIESMALFER